METDFRTVLGERVFGEAFRDGRDVHPGFRRIDKWCIFARKRVAVLVENSLPGRLLVKRQQLLFGKRLVYRQG
jgi:hypothetical protein